MWKESGILPEGLKAKVQQFNDALDAAGLLTKIDGIWHPTAEGIAIGIVQYQGGSGDRTYVSPIYSPKTQEKLTQIIKLNL